MKKSEQEAFYKILMSAKESLNKKEIEAFRVKIASAFILDMDAPETHNLIGVMYEILGDENLARKHYRAAYALDPTFKPACRNLERMVLDWKMRPQDYDFGI